MDQTLGIFDALFGKPDHARNPYTFDRMDDIERAQESNENEAERLEKEKDVERERIAEKERAEREKTL